MSHSPRHWPSWSALILVGAVVLPLSGCSDSSPSTGNPRCTFTYQCMDGLVCENNECVVPGSNGGPTCEELGNCPPPTCEELGNCPEPEPTCEELGNCPPPPPECTVDTECAGSKVCRNGQCATIVPIAADYVVCSDDLDCGVGAGNCVKTLTLSTPTPDGKTSVTIQEIDSSVPAGKGICTRTCTTDVNTCGTLSARVPAGVDGSFTCQVVYEGKSPYDYAIESATALDLTAMGRGTSFASICRPPFQLATSRSPDLCKACTADAQCGGDTKCFIESPDAAAPAGSCVETCASQSDCAFGFTCDEIEQGGPTYCIPVANTCGRCVDGDGDGFGVGVCGSKTNPNQGVDCDDTKAHTYFNQRNQNHPFPAYCGQEDRNCNGKSDDTEIIGSTQHCSACGDICDSSSPNAANGSLTCEPNGGSFGCELRCQEGFLDCGSAPGCETDATTLGMWYIDADEDGFPNPLSGTRKCPAEIALIQATPNPGYDSNGVRWIKDANEFDCDDNDSTVYPGAVELCDGKRQNCRNAGIDINVAGTNVACTHPEKVGACAEGIVQCINAETLCVTSNQPTNEFCDGRDNNCDGRVDNIPVPQGCIPETPVESATWRPFGECLQIAGVCEPRDGCVPGVGNCSYDLGCAFHGVGVTESRSGLSDANCDGFVGDASKSVFVALPGDGAFAGSATGTGTPERPFDTVQAGINAACAGVQPGEKCKDIIVEAGTYSSTAAITIPAVALSGSGLTAVNIYGGYSVICDPQSLEILGQCKPAWRPSTANSARSTFTRSITQSVVNGVTGGAVISVIRAVGSDTTFASFELNNVTLATSIQSGVRGTKGQITAPTLAGIECPVTGCGNISLKKSTISIPTAIGGYQPEQVSAMAPPAESGQMGQACMQGNCHDFVPAGQERYDNSRLRAGIPSQCSDPTFPTNESARGVRNPVQSMGFKSSVGCVAMTMVRAYLESSGDVGIDYVDFNNGGSRFHASDYDQAYRAFCQLCKDQRTDDQGYCLDSNGYRDYSSNYGRGDRGIWNLIYPEQYASAYGRGGEPGGGRQKWNESGFENPDGGWHYFIAQPGANGHQHSNGAAPGKGGRAGAYVYWETNERRSGQPNIWVRIVKQNDNNNGVVHIEDAGYNVDREMKIAPRSGETGSNGSNGSVSATTSKWERRANGFFIGAPTPTTPQAGGGGGGGGGGAGCTDEGPDNWDCGASARLYEGIGGGGGAGGCGGFAGENGGHGGSIVGVLFVPSAAHGDARLLFASSTSSRDEAVSINIASGARGSNGTDGTAGQKGGSGGGAPAGFPSVFAGANGGDGGGGGGGVGGNGGLSTGVLLSCPSETPEVCRGRIPSRLNGLPTEYITISGQAAAGGTGGNHGSSSPKATDGRPGANNEIFVIQ